MCPPGYHHNGFVATHAHGHMMHGYHIYIYIYIYILSILKSFETSLNKNCERESNPIPKPLYLYL